MLFPLDVLGLFILIVFIFGCGAFLLAKKRLNMGAGVVLAGSLLIYTQCNRRSQTGRYIRLLKGEGMAMQHLDDLEEDTKKTVDPLELQRWAVSVLHENQFRSPYGEIPISKAPLGIQRLRSEGVQCDRVFLYDDETIARKDRCIFISWEESGSAGWGILVGAPECEPESGVKGYLVKWKPGIYFWCSPP